MAIHVGVAVIIVKVMDGEPHVLVGQRKGSQGSGAWAVPGGHLEHGESFEGCAAREVAEEAGIAPLPRTRFAHALNTVFSNGKHYVTIFMRTTVGPDVEARLMEPDKCGEWRWCRWGDIPEPRFEPLQQLLDCAEFTLIPN